MGAVENQRLALLGEPFGLEAAHVRGGHFPQDDVAHLVVRGPGDGLTSSPGVQDAPGVNREVGDGGVGVDFDGQIGPHVMSGEVAGAEMHGGDVVDVVGAEAEVEVAGDGTIVEGQADPDVPARRRRQRRPPTVIFMVAPSHPRRTPLPARMPNPTAMGMMEPATVVERSPAPTVIGLPIPSLVGPEPGTVIDVGPPPDAGRRGDRLPAPAVILDIDPSAVGGERVVIIIDGRLVRLRRRGVGRDGLNRGWWGGDRLHRLHRDPGDWGLGRHLPGGLRGDGLARQSGDVGGRSLDAGQLGVAAEHRVDDRGRKADVRQIDNRIGLQGEGDGPPGDVGQHDIIPEPVVVELDDLDQASGELDRRRGG